ncbi:hypothetical protein ACOMHN_024930 [Nucella lapillus]
MTVVRPGKETRGKSTMLLITRLEDSKSMITTGIMMKKWRRSQDPRNVDIIQTEYFKPPIMIVTKTQLRSINLAQRSPASTTSSTRVYQPQPGRAPVAPGHRTYSQVVRSMPKPDRGQTSRREGLRNNHGNNGTRGWRKQSVDSTHSTESAVSEPLLATATDNTKLVPTNDMDCDTDTDIRVRPEGPVTQERRIRTLPEHVRHADQGEKRTHAANHVQPIHSALALARKERRVKVASLMLLGRVKRKN